MKKREARVKGSSRVGGQVKEYISSYFIEIGLGKNFLSIETMEETTKEMIDMLDYIKFQLLCIKTIIKQT